MRFTRSFAVLFVLPLALGFFSGVAQAQADSGGRATAATINQVLGRMSQREAALVVAMRKYHPLVETYLQTVRPDQELGAVPVSDHYFLGRIDLNNGFGERFYTTGLEKAGWKTAVHASLAPTRLVTNMFTVDFLPVGFSSMLFPDTRGFNPNRYAFKFLRREFLGTVRCLVFDVTPLNHDHGRYTGRVWVEDKDYNIVRFNGVYTHPVRDTYFHMDSWRTNVASGEWLPTVIYQEESGLKPGTLKPTVRFRGQTRLWGYDLKQAGRQEEFSSIEVEGDNGQAVSEDDNSATDFSPLMSLRAWEREAEDNVIDRLETAGLLAPAGSLDKILETVVTNIEAGSDLSVEPEIRCRVLLTSPLESTSIGHTIVISRGLLDVLPDEASLAMVLAHEMGHIAGGEQIDTKYSFGDRLQFKDEAAYHKLGFEQSAGQEEEADKRGMELLKNSIYKDKLAGAGLFLRQLQERASAMPNLMQARLGNGVIENGTVRMSQLMSSAPALAPGKTDQVAALPLGGRVKVAPWNGHAELLKARPAAVMSAREKRPFEVLPVVMGLSRVADGGPSGQSVASLSK